MTEPSSGEKKKVFNSNDAFIHQLPSFCFQNMKQQPLTVYHLINYY